MSVKLRRLLMIVALLTVQAPYADEETRGEAYQENKAMSENEDHVPSVDALLPYQSAIASFSRKMPADELLAFTIAIRSPAESYAIMIQRELESKSEYGIEVTVTPIYDSRQKPESWRIFAISKPLRLGDLDEEQHHAIAGWAFAVAAYFQSELLTFNYRL